MTSLRDVPAPLLEELTGAGLDLDHVWDTIVRALREDVPDVSMDDPTSSSTISPEARGEAVFAAREAGVVAGLGVAAVTFFMVGADATVTDRVLDGTRVEKGDVVMRITGLTQRMLVAERTALNLASHLSGIATATAEWVDALAGSPTRVLDTRKTLPGLRAFQKYAVRCGGGVNHRFSLADRAMVKDNHVIAAGGVVPAYEAVRAAYPELRVEVEVTDLDQLRELLAAGCTEILLDNMSAETMAEAVRITDGRATLEASGGLTIERAREVGATGVDFISVGALTHSATTLDLSMLLEAA
jgi:nicotinate-nucleotide pyrophosphorylase (carboxylating)